MITEAVFGSPYPPALLSASRRACATPKISSRHTGAAQKPPRPAVAQSAGRASAIQRSQPRFPQRPRSLPTAPADCLRLAGGAPMHPGTVFGPRERPCGSQRLSAALRIHWRCFPPPEAPARLPGSVFGYPGRSEASAAGCGSVGGARFRKPTVAGSIPAAASKPPSGPRGPSSVLRSRPEAPRDRFRPPGAPLRPAEAVFGSPHHPVLLPPPEAHQNATPSVPWCVPVASRVSARGPFILLGRQYRRV